MAVVSRTAFASSLAAKVNDNTSGQISALDMREVLTDLEDSAGWHDEIVPRAQSVNLTVGYTTTSPNPATGSGTFTPLFSVGNLQRITNSGAFTLAAPNIGEGTMIIEVTNAAGAGVVTFSGFFSVTGATLTTTVGHRFLLSIARVGANSWLVVTAASGNA